MNNTEHAPVYNNTGLIDRVDCLCGWKGAPFFDGYEWALNDWEKHKEQISMSTYHIALRVAYEIQAQCMLAINTVDEPHSGAYKVIRELDIIKIVSDMKFDLNKEDV